MRRQRPRTHLARETIRHLTNLHVVNGGLPWSDVQPGFIDYTTTADEACSGSCCTKITQTY